MTLIRRSINLPKPKKISLAEYHKKRNTVLVIRQTGGVGDILMTRMIFEDIKKLMPEARIEYALPAEYHELVRDHPFIDEIKDYEKVNPSDYVISYNISTACGRYEQKVSPLADLHRSDIWASHCGFDLTNHDMHIQLDDDDKEFARNVIEKYRKGQDKPVVLLCPVSAMVSKNLDINQINETIEGLEKENCVVMALHHKLINNINAPTLYRFTFRQWLAVINAADYIISVDSAAFHAAGGLDKPAVGIFSWADGKVYGKWHKRYVLVQRHRDNGDWDCGPCYCWPFCPLSNDQRKPCITEITSSEVIEAAKKMMQYWPRSKNGISK